MAINPLGRVAGELDALKKKLDELSLTQQQTAAKVSSFRSAGHSATPDLVRRRAVVFRFHSLDLPNPGGKEATRCDITEAGADGSDAI